MTQQLTRCAWVQSPPARTAVRSISPCIRRDDPPPELCSFSPKCVCAKSQSQSRPARCASWHWGLRSIKQTIARSEEEGGGVLEPSPPPPHAANGPSRRSREARRMRRRRRRRQRRASACAVLEAPRGPRAIGEGSARAAAAQTRRAPRESREARVRSPRLGGG